MTTAQQHGLPQHPGDYVIVLFGATGDLAKRKLLPGLFHLAVAGLLPHKYRIIGTSPAKYAISNEEFQEHARQACQDFCISKPVGEPWAEFSQHLSFASSDTTTTPRSSTRSSGRRRQSAVRRGGCSTWPCRRPRSARWSACSVSPGWPPISPG